MKEELPVKTITLRNVKASGAVYDLVGLVEDLDSISGALGVDKIIKVNARLKVKPWRQDGVFLDGEVTLQCLQSCVVTGDPLETDLEFAFERYFLPDVESNRAVPEIVDGEWVLDPQGEDPPDLAPDGRLDLWQVVLEEINLHIDAFPRAGNAEMALQDDAQPARESEGSGHFSKLKALITEKKTKN